MRAVVLLGLLGLFGLPACSATDDGGASLNSSPGPRTFPPAAFGEGALAERAERLASLALEAGSAYRLLTSLCTTAPHRLSGSKGSAKAIEWGRQQMLRLGLANVRLEKVMVPHWERGEVERLTAATGESLRVTALGGSIGTPRGGLTGEVIEVRTFEQLRKIGARARGKIVFFNRPMNPRLLNTFIAYGQAVPQRGSGPSETARVGGIATIVRSMTTRIDDHPHTGATRYVGGERKVPAAAISTKGAERLAAMLDEGPVRLTLELSCRTLPDTESANVVGDLRGTDLASEIVVIGGHLDAWDVGQGAHDDGAGIAHCLAAIDLLKQARIRNRRTIRVVLFTNEENGLRGGAAYAEAHAHELDKHVAAIESDRGGLLPRGFTTTARGERLVALKKLLEPLRAFDAGIVIPGGGGPDIGPLGRTGTELFGLLPSSQRYFDYHHSELDTLAAVNPRELELGAASVAYLASLLADAR